MPKAKKTVKEVKETAQTVDTSNYDKWTYDIRDEFKYGITKKDLAQIEERLNFKERTIGTLFCTDEQLKTIKTFPEYATIRLITR